MEASLDFFFFLNRIIRLAENGIFVRFLDCGDKIARTSCRSSKITLYENLNQYEQEYSGFSNLVLDNFYCTFHLYTLLCLLFFAAFAVHHLVQLIKTIAVIARPLVAFYIAFAKIRFANGLAKLTRYLLDRMLFKK